MTSGSTDDRIPATGPDPDLLRRVVDVAERLASEDPLEDHYSRLADELQLFPTVTASAFFAIDEYNDVQILGHSSTCTEADARSMKALAEDRFNIVDLGDRTIQDGPGDLATIRLFGAILLALKMTEVPGSHADARVIETVIEGILPSLRSIDRGRRLFEVERELGGHRQLEKKISESLSRVADVETLGRSVQDLAEQLFEVEYAGIYFRDPASRHLRLVGAKGLEQWEIEDAEKTAWDRHPGRVIRTGEMVHVHDTRNDPLRRTVTSKRRVEIRSRCYLPVNSGSEVVGTLGLASTRAGAFGAKHIEALQFLADLAGLTWSRLLEQMRRERRDMILIAAGEATEMLLRSRTWEDCLPGLLDLIRTSFAAYSVQFIYPSGDRIGVREEDPPLPKGFLAAAEKIESLGFTGGPGEPLPGAVDGDPAIPNPYLGVPLFNGDRLEGVILVTDIGNVRVHDKNSIAGLRAFTDPLTSKIARDQLEQGLVKHERMEALGQLAGGVAHDINNLLMPILGLASTLADDESDPNRKARLEDIKLAAERGRDFVEQVLLLTRRRVATDERTHLRGAIEEVVTLLSSTTSPWVDLHSNFVVDDGVITGDRTAILRLIQNLVVNAREAIGQKAGRIEVRLDRSEDEPPRMIVEVRDNGSGMPEHVRARLFDAFFTTRRHGTEQGLGLTIVNRIVSELGGEIEVKSEMHTGSTFRILLPEADAVEVEDDAASPGEDPTPSETHGRLVLLVDDNDMVLSTSCALLQSLGYEVVPTASGAEALKWFENSDRVPELVLSDLSMPNMDGIELVTRLRAMDFEGAAVLITGYGDDSMDSAFDAGVDDVLRKPISRDELGVALERTIAARG